MGEESLLQETARRLTGARFSPVLVVSGEDQRFFIKRQLDVVEISVEAILLEPEGRNTSAAATLAAAWLVQAGSDELMLLMPSDHVIGDADAFLAAIEKGIPSAEQGAIVTFGAQPTEPNTQYGYIEAATDREHGDGVFPIARFVEKPDAATSAEYLASGRFFWNAGIFLVKASTLLNEMRQFLPSSLDAITKAVTESSREGSFVRPNPEAFAAAENISIDHAIMEKTSRGVVVPVQMRWSDIGSWDAVWKAGRKDANNNLTNGDIVTVDTRNSLLRNDSGLLVSGVGLDGMAVIADEDAILIAPLGRASEVKTLVDNLKRQGRSCASSRATQTSDWGTSRVLHEGPSFRIQHLTICGGAEFAGQLGSKQSEQWIVLCGSAEAIVNGAASTLGQGQSIHLDAGTEFRVVNTGAIDLELVAIGLGRSVDPDDECNPLKAYQ